MVRNRFLIDTQIFIWGMERNKKLPTSIISILQNSEYEIFISVASVWEIVIKKAKGSLKTPQNLEESIKEAGFKLLSIELSHALGVGKLPFYKDHKDPFDRVLISQAKVETLILITTDPKIWKYKIPLMKA